MIRILLLAIFTCLVLVFSGCNLIGSNNLGSAGKSTVKNITKNLEVTAIEDVDEFKAAVSQCSTYERMIELLFNALYMYEIKGKEIADKMMMEIVDKDLILTDGKDFTASTSMHLNKILQNKEYIRSYIGAKPSEYILEFTGSFKITFLPNKTMDMTKGKKKFFVRSSGKDWDSPVQIQKSEAGFKIAELSSLATGVKK